MDEVLTRVRSAHRALDAKDETRDGMLNAKRGVTADAREVVNLAHRGRFDEAREAYRGALDRVEAIRDSLDPAPELWHSGALRNALQELAEAWAVLALLDGEAELPEEALTPEALVLGVADAVGELRRRALDALIEDEPGEAEARLEQMETLYEELRRIDLPGGVVDLKHKVDVARTLVDKTRGKVALSRVEARMGEAADGPAGELAREGD